MTVRLLDGSPDNEATHNVKWRKHGFCKVLERSLLLELDNDTLTRVLGFLGYQNDGNHVPGDDENVSLCDRPMMYLKDAGKLHLQIASICKHLRQFCDANLKYVLGPIDANFFGLKEKYVVPSILWLLKYQCQLGTLKIRADLADVPLLCKLLHKCDTAGLWNVQGHLCQPTGAHTIDFNELRDNSRFITLAWMDKFQSTVPHVGDTAIIDLTEIDSYNPSLQRMAWDLGIPFKENPDQKLWHDMIARECPNLTHLSVNCKLPHYPAWKSSNYSRALFSMPKIQQLSLSFGLFREKGYLNRYNFRANFLEAYIKNLDSLVELDIGFTRTVCAIMKAFHIDSRTLRRLDVQRLGKHVWVSCKCPHLERFICSGEILGNGTRPDWTHEQCAAYQGGDVMYAESTPMIGMNVPATCEFVLKDFSAIRPIVWDLVRNAHYVRSDDDEFIL